MSIRLDESVRVNWSVADVQVLYGKWLDPKELAEVLGCSVETLAGYRQSRQSRKANREWGPRFHKLKKRGARKGGGRFVFYRMSDVIVWLEVRDFRRLRRDLERIDNILVRMSELTRTLSTSANMKKQPDASTVSEATWREYPVPSPVLGPQGLVTTLRQREADQDEEEIWPT